MHETTTTKKHAVRFVLIGLSLLWLIIVNFLFFSGRVENSAFIHTIWKKATTVWSH
jgi:hypothetical protein